MKREFILNLQRFWMRIIKDNWICFCYCYLKKDSTRLLFLIFLFAKDFEILCKVFNVFHRTTSIQEAGRIFKDESSLVNAKYHRAWRQFHRNTSYRANRSLFLLLLLLLLLYMMVNAMKSAATKKHKKTVKNKEQEMKKETGNRKSWKGSDFTWNSWSCGCCCLLVFHQFFMIVFFRTFPNFPWCKERPNENDPMIFHHNFPHLPIFLNMFSFPFQFFIFIEIFSNSISICSQILIFMKIFHNFVKLELKYFLFHLNFHENLSQFLWNLKPNSH